MPVPPRWKRLFRLRPWNAESDVDAELRFHFEERTADLMALGATRDEAQARVAREFGDVDAVRATLVAIDQRVAAQGRRAEWWEMVLHDATYAVRQLRRSPTFALAIVLTLALGVSTNAAMFSVIDQLMFRPPALLRDPERVRRVYLASSDHNEEQAYHAFEYPRYLDLVRWTSSFEQAAALVPASLTVGPTTQAREIETEAVSASFWRLFAIDPVVGRFFTGAEDVPPQGTAVVVVSAEYWRTQLGGGRDALGKKIQIGARFYSVIGVAPDGFVGIPSGRRRAALFIPLASLWSAMGDAPDGAAISIPDQYAKYEGHWVEMIVRLRAGVGPAAANADLTNAFRRSYEVERALNPALPSLADARPRAAAGPILIDRCNISGTSPCESDLPAEGQVAVLVTGLVIIVFLIACANAANLMFARAARRRREIAMRLALGISRRRLAGQLLVESLVLATLAGAVGILLAQWASAILAASFLPAGESLPILSNPHILVFGLAISGVAVLATGLAPALMAGRDDLAATLKAGARDGPSRPSRLGSALVIVQATLCALLLVAAGLCTRSLTNGRALRPGFDVDPVLFGLIHTRGTALADHEKSDLLRRLRDEAATIPGVVSASRTSGVPLGPTAGLTLAVAGFDSLLLSQFATEMVSSEYFGTVGTRVLRGRGITTADEEGAPPVIVVSETMARRLWPGKDALGQCVRVGPSPAPCATVVGVAEDINQHLPDAGLYDYVSIDQFDPTFATVAVRTNGDARRYATTVRDHLQRLLPANSYIEVTPMRDAVNRTLSPWQLGATMFNALGGMALLLAALGLYSVIAHGVAQRTQELGVRVAVGAQTTDILRLIVGGGVRLAGIGIAIGCAIMLAASSLIGPLLFDEGPRDPVVFGTVSVGLMIVAIAASLIPAWSASRIDPTVALRND